jgi:biopolymer transport protein ExbD
MSMNVQSADHDEVELNTTINTTPLVDVMLVLLIIFLITMPVIVKTVPLHASECAQYPDDHQAREHRHRGGQGREHLLEQRARSR